MGWILHLYLEVKDPFTKLHPLSGVRNSVVKATLCQPEHLRHTHTDKVGACDISISHVFIVNKALFIGLPERQFQSCPHSTFRWHTCTRDRSVPKCSSLVPATVSGTLVKHTVCSCSTLIKSSSRCALIPWHCQGWAGRWRTRAGRVCSLSCKSQVPLCPRPRWSRWCLCSPVNQTAVCLHIKEAHITVQNVTLYSPALWFKMIRLGMFTFSAKRNTKINKQDFFDNTYYESPVYNAL